MGREHTIDPALIHHVWDRSLPPALAVGSGDTVHFDIPMAGHGQVELGSTIDEARFDFDTMYNLAGPLHVEGAQPGHTLRIDILDLQPGDWGWCAILPGFGLLPDDFPTGYLKTFDLSAGGPTTTLVPGVEIPLAPFFGTMGNHPGVPERNLPFPPHRGGGNMDNRHLVAGTTLWLPVWCEGALFSVGDPHAAQGDGEVCVAAIECPMRASLRFTLEKRSIHAPMWQSPGGLTPRSDDGGYQATMGIADDLMEGARIAVRAMVDWIVGTHGLTREDAYVLCSVAGDLKILEVVDAGMWNVGFTLPRRVFTGA